MAMVSIPGNGHYKNGAVTYDGVKAWCEAEGYDVPTIFLPGTGRLTDPKHPFKEIMHKPIVKVTDPKSLEKNSCWQCFYMLNLKALLEEGFTDFYAIRGGGDGCEWERKFLEATYKEMFDTIPQGMVEKLVAATFPNYKVRRTRLHVCTLAVGQAALAVCIAWWCGVAMGCVSLLNNTASAVPHHCHAAYPITHAACVCFHARCTACASTHGVLRVRHGSFLPKAKKTIQTIQTVKAKSGSIRKAARSTAVCSPSLPPSFAPCLGFTCLFWVKPLAW